MTDALKLPFAGEEIARRLSQTLEEPDWLLDERLDASRRYAELPAEINPLFTTYLDLRAARFSEIEPYTETGEASEVSATVPEGAAALLHVDEDRVVARALSRAARDAGVIVDTFANVLRERPALLRDALAGGTTLPTDDKFAQFARAHAALGVLVHVPDGVVLEQPIVLRWSVGKPGRGLVARSVLSLGENARASALEEQVPAVGGAQAGQSLWWGTSEVLLGDGAQLSFAAQQDFGPDTLMFVNRQATLGRDARLQWALASVGGQLQKSRIDNRLVGRGASVQQAEIGFGGGSQLFDLTSYTRHIGEDTTGDLLSKGVFTDRARGYFKGLIEIQRSARGTDSFLGEFAMLLTRKARSVAIPSLEIDQPDVRRAAHSSSVGPIDEAQVFYLMSRGLPRDLARKFIVMGFLEPVVARIPLPEAQDRLRELLEAKWPEAPAEAA
ncbi:MAG TPA: SufD family Fe-S cluster assembly protein [Candidatus Limnocylindria bacterium]|nr:SufD family Fe-S cluster assembly protein [Candidatus Limnocylindria bacterium]